MLIWMLFLIVKAPERKGEGHGILGQAAAGVSAAVHARMGVMPDSTLNERTLCPKFKASHVGGAALIV